MPANTAQKLKIKEGFLLRTLNAPAGFAKKLGSLPGGVEIVESGKEFNQFHWFVHNRSQMEKELPKVLPLIKGDIVCWIYYPKGSSGLQTDLTRDRGWEALLQHGDSVTWISLISFDDTWSVFGFRAKSEADRKKESKPKEVRAIFDYIDTAAKTVRLPDDLAAALGKKKKEKAFFDALSFTNRKEYVEWVVSAKREETRAERVKGTIERLGKEWKNPANR
ncbi:MAG: YdeI/OmpD-associated family protein [Bacteroidetes bacterium]|nr:YdeI/OmpD-associated family protein [Bacteroidota bacterium]